MRLVVPSAKGDDTCSFLTELHIDPLSGVYDLIASYVILLQTPDFHVLPLAWCSACR